MIACAKSYFVDLALLNLAIVYYTFYKKHIPLAKKTLFLIKEITYMGKNHYN